MFGTRRLSRVDEDDPSWLRPIDPRCFYSGSIRSVGEAPQRGRHPGRSDEPHRLRGAAPRRSVARTSGRVEIIVVNLFGWFA